MQLSRRLLPALLLFLALPAVATAQSLAPTHGSGPTPTAIKGFRLTVGNPYRTAMTFLVLPMDVGFRHPVGDVEILPPKLTLAPGFTRQVILAFKIPQNSKERTIGLCVQPEKLAGPVLPRVCGRYTGVRLAGVGG
jgi:hypothetical protein